MKKALLAVLLIIILVSCNQSNSENEKIVLIEYQQLEAKKADIESGDNQAISDYNRLIKKADSVLIGGTYSVVNKESVPPSGDKHDYMSLGPYWWPNPDTPDRLPYIRKDGEINPEARNNFTDYVEAKAFFSSISILKGAYYYSNKEVYANKAIQLINTWFIEKETKMNPNFNYGQSIPGITDGRKFGIIEFRNIIEVLECLELLKKRNLLNHKTEEAFKKWLTDYAYWLQNSENGIGEANTKNNHGTLYDVQLLSILTFLGRIDSVKTHLMTKTKNRIFTQIEPNGSQPKELARTKSFSYSVMNLHGFLYLARLGQKVGVDIWGIESEDGRSIQKAYEYLLPYVMQEKEWEYKQIIDVDHQTKNLISDLKYTRDTFNCKAFDTILKFIENKNTKIKFTH